MINIKTFKSVNIQQYPPPFLISQCRILSHCTVTASGFQCGTNTKIQNPQKGSRWQSVLTDSVVLFPVPSGWLDALSKDKGNKEATSPAVIIWQQVEQGCSEHCREGDVTERKSYLDLSRRSLVMCFKCACVCVCARVCMPCCIIYIILKTIREGVNIPNSFVQVHSG